MEIKEIYDLYKEYLGKEIVVWWRNRTIKNIDVNT